MAEMSLLPTRPGDFDAWLRMPFEYTSSDPRFDVRRATPAEYEQIFDCVDEAFGVRRPRSLFDWLYRLNPGGHARCWVVIERRSGRLLASSASWPWPLAYGSEALEGVLAGDSVVLPDHQRQGLPSLRRGGWIADTLRAGETVFSWPNEKSVRWLQKHGLDPQLLGPLTRATLDLTPGSIDRRIGRWLRGDRSRRKSRRSLPIVEIDRFDADFDAVTALCTASKGFWCPHDASFLNWRYRDHPIHEYRALAVLEGEAVAGYAVVCARGHRATLMELAAPEAGDVADRLLDAVLETAREAGCRRLGFFASPAWRHWPRLRRWGFACRPAAQHVYLDGCPPVEALRLESWQLLPGDSDSD
jgi:hypothetical protein